MRLIQCSKSRIDLEGSSLYKFDQSNDSLESFDRFQFIFNDEKLFLNVSSF